jgi:hypothetical protein
MEGKQVRHAMRTLRRDQCSEARSRWDLVEDALALAASWGQQTGLSSRNALKTIDAKLLPAFLLDVSLRLVDDGR